MNAAPNQNLLTQSMQNRQKSESLGTLGNRPHLNSAVFHSPNRAIVSFTNDISDLLGLGIHDQNILSKMTRATSISVNGVPIPATEQRSVPIFNGRYTLSFSTLPGFVATINEITEGSAIWIKAALIKMATMPVNPFKFEFTFECDHDGEQEQYISNSLVEQKHFIDLLEQPKGLWNTLYEFAQSKISWTDWLSIRFDLPRVGQY
jgi:hypothetical protein